MFWGYWIPSLLPQNRALTFALDHLNSEGRSSICFSIFMELLAILTLQFRYIYMVFFSLQVFMYIMSSNKNWVV